MLYAILSALVVYLLTPGVGAAEDTTSSAAKAVAQLKIQVDQLQSQLNEFKKRGNGCCSQGLDKIFSYVTCSSFLSHLPEQVKLVVYKGGQAKQYATFNGAGTNFYNWMTPARLVESSWTDLKSSSTNFFSPAGDGGLRRRFFINHVYPGCDGDAGWLVVKDENDVCSWGNPTGVKYPLILFSPSSTLVHCGSRRLTGRVGEDYRGHQPERRVSVVSYPGGVQDVVGYPGLLMCCNPRLKMLYAITSALVVYLLTPGCCSQEFYQENGFILAFRLVAGIGDKGYDAFINENRDDDVALCQGRDPVRVPFELHYVQPALPELHLQSLVPSSNRNRGQAKQYALFNGTGSTYSNWMTAARLIESSWTDLKSSTTNFFSITGDEGLRRRFLINHAYPGCLNDNGWLLVKDGTDTCAYGNPTGVKYPLILFSPLSTLVTYTSAADRADSLAVWVKVTGVTNLNAGCQ
ncbi:hypothetical protein C0Q70_02936 [Pomacea canaliculata]|uniref:Fibrinogen C-terminal domain-containing protein n=1 Tax=Pomacea canaliculata TaxID=400727 RepID=A0A2T7PRG6_POMCA|nr:hypothetical protein C0Q70_02936 [Pomacea canaliculata]